MGDYRIPFNRPCLTGKELEYISQAVRLGHISGDGLFTKRCHALLADELGVAKVLLTTSGTHALDIAALALDIQPGDEVIVPSFTFVSTVNAFVLRGAKPVFADIRPDTLNLDESQLESLLSPRTRVIVPVHYAGVACEMDTICPLAESRGIHVVEDNAHGLFGRYRGRYLGTFGCLAAQSFHETKNFHCGEGGAILINNPALVERIEIIREKGTNRSRFFRGEVNKYGWMDVGSSYLPSDLLAAFLYAQLESRSDIQARRQHLWERYYRLLGDWAGQHEVRLPVVPAHCEQPYHIFYLLLPTAEQRQAVISHLKARGILSVFHYLPLHTSDMGRRLGGAEYACPVTDWVADRLLRLPFYNDMTDEEQDEVVTAITEVGALGRAQNSRLGAR
jgi:dTDP-4-amino-4,6-dideoxygalactose transaminase